ncbi:MAG TPA: DUF1579 family protein [Acidobacteriota bacterium]
MRIKNLLYMLGILLLPFAAISQEQTQTAPQMSEETKQMMEVWMKMATPGAEHKQLMTLAGEYKIASKFRMEPGGPLTDSTAQCEKKAVLGDRYLMEHCNGEAMAGMPPFEGMGLLGYNNYTKQYEMYWFDNMSTMGFVLKGKADATGKVITVKGTYEDPASKKMKKTRWVLTIQDANTHKLELFDTDSKGKEFLGAELHYTRK